MFDVLKRLFDLLDGEGIVCCLSGELALNYYNVPRVIHEAEICVPIEKLAKATELFAKPDSGLQQGEPPEIDIFTEYKSKYSRFRDKICSDVNVVLLPDTVYGFEVNQAALRSHLQAPFYSKEILSVLSPAEVTALPFPTLQQLLGGACEVYKRSNQTIFAMASEQLVDGMNITVGMCTNHLQVDLEARKFAVELARSRRERIDYFSDNAVTCIIANEEDAKLLLRIPGHFVTTETQTLHEQCCSETSKAGLSSYSAANGSDTVETHIQTGRVSDTRSI